MGTDHRTSSVHFGTDLAESQKAEVAEGPHVQAMPSEQVRTQLINMFNVLNKSLDTINPDRLQIETAELKTKITEAYHQSKVRDHQRLLARHKIIEERKEWLETINTAKMEESQKQQRDELMKQKVGRPRGWLWRERSGIKRGASRSSSPSRPSTTRTRSSSLPRPTLARKCSPVIWFVPGTTIMACYLCYTCIL